MNVKANRGVKVFWQRASITPTLLGQYAVTLDQKVIKTPEGRAFVLSSKPLASMVSAEWEIQKTFVKASTLPLTTLTSVVLDQKNEKSRSIKDIADDILSFFETDTLCFRAEEYSSNLAQKQKELWNPILEFVEKLYNIKIETTTSLSIFQSLDTKNKILDIMLKMSSFQLAGFESMVRAAKSVVVPLALINYKITLEEAANVVYLETSHQIGRWGMVEDAHDVEQEELRVRMGAGLMFYRLGDSA
eukprot:Pompholyxophrys_punicea_v1_NODE_135_length_3273_cov_11.162523.p1 type:complete len:246 gc:universal NODE_135_length_3273_cov_11.162523:53-790(+)